MMQGGDNPKGYPPYGESLLQKRKGCREIPPPGKAFCKKRKVK
jgi:hypothetical protein